MSHQDSIDERLRFKGLDERTIESLRAIAPVVDAALPSALDHFYDLLNEFEFARGFFPSPEIVAHVKAKQGEHWRRLISGNFDGDYAMAVRRVGEAHARLGLPPRWYIGGYSRVASHCVQTIIRGHASRSPEQPLECLAEGVGSLLKAMFLDIDLAISIYLEALEEQRQREEEARLIAERNQTIVVQALSAALAKVAEGDLNAMVEIEVSAEYEQLKHDFNTALARLVEAKHEAESASRAKSDFLSNISHEIRTPLNGVIGVAGVLSVTELTVKQQEMVDLVRTSAEVVERLLSDILDVSKLEAGAMALEEAPFNLCRVVEGAVGLFGAKAAGKSIGLKIHSQDCAQENVVGDAVRLAQVVSNLVSNAIKFTNEGGVTVTLDCAPASDQADRVQVTIKVADTGIGFDPATAPRLFDRFSQADTSITRLYGGTGLGLSICKGIVDAMGGRLTATSTPGLGSEFVVELDFRRQEGDHDRPAYIRSLGQEGRLLARPDQAAAGLGASEGFSRPSILVVDDHPTNRMVVRLMLESLNLDIVEATDGLEALRLYAEQMFDVVLMDMHMPNMDGLAATNGIRAIETAEGRQGAWIAMLTANVADEQREAAFKAGADAHLAKPIQHERLLTSVLSAIQRRSSNA